MAALYIDPERGPYASMQDVEPWGVDRDATQYAGPWPVVAHPPCGHWGKLAWNCKQPAAWKAAGPVAVAQVREFGGVLEHPAHSRLWDACTMPPAGGLPDGHGGWTLEAHQTRWGHKAKKRTWFYIVGVARNAVTLPPDRAATHVMGVSLAKGRVLPCLPKKERHLTPPALAEWLVALARGSHVD